MLGAHGTKSSEPTSARGSKVSPSCASRSPLSLARSPGPLRSAVRLLSASRRLARRPPGVRQVRPGPAAARCHLDSVPVNIPWLPNPEDPLSAAVVDCVFPFLKSLNKECGDAFTSRRSSVLPRRLPTNQDRPSGYTAAVMKPGRPRTRRGAGLAWVGSGPRGTRPVGQSSSSTGDRNCFWKGAPACFGQWESGRVHSVLPLASALRRPAEGRGVGGGGGRRAGGRLSQGPGLSRASTGRRFGRADVVPRVLQRGRSGRLRAQGGGAPERSSARARGGRAGRPSSPSSLKTAKGLRRRGRSASHQRPRRTGLCWAVTIRDSLSDRRCWELAFQSE